MTIKYASVLAATKFRTRLGRSIITVVAASLVASIMLIASFVVTGVRSSIQGVSETKISQMNMAEETIFDNSFFEAAPTDSTTVPKPKVSLSLADYKKSIDSYHPQSVFYEIAFGSYSLPGSTAQSPTSNDSSSLKMVNGRSDEFFAASLDTSTPAAVLPGTIPFAVSTDVILSLQKIKFKDSDTAEYRVSKTLEAENVWRGKEITLTNDDQTAKLPTLKGTVVGFISSGGIFGEGGGSAVLFPLETAHKVYPDFPVYDESNTTYYASFANQTDLLKFVDGISNSFQSNLTTYMSAHVFGNPMMQFQELEDSVASVLKYVILVLLAAVVIAMMTTLSKIIADSERETGVFRAIGAKRSDIMQIYFSYSALVSVLAMLVAVLIALGVCAYLTHAYSANLTYELLTVTGSLNLTTRVTLFAVNWLNLIEVFGAILAASLLGTIIPLSNLLRKDPIKALRAE